MNVCAKYKRGLVSMEEEAAKGVAPNVQGQTQWQKTG